VFAILAVASAVPHTHFNMLRATKKDYLKWQDVCPTDSEKCLCVAVSGNICFYAETVFIFLHLAALSFLDGLRIAIGQTLL
jgi:hypothetical protein